MTRRAVPPTASDTSDDEGPAFVFVPKSNGLGPLTLTEKVNKAALQVMLAHPEETKLSEMKAFNGRDRVGGDDCLTILKNYLDRCNHHGEHPTVYDQNRDRQGRYSAVKSNGLGNLPRPIRHTICRDDEGRPLYVDIDMKNAHPVMLAWLCDKYEAETPRLLDYIARRDEYLEMAKDLLRGYPDEEGRPMRGTRDDAKRLYLSWMYGAKIPKDHPALKNRTLAKFHKELEAINSYICQVNPAYVKMAKDAKRRKAEKITDEAKRRKAASNVEGSAVSRLMGDIENTALWIIIGVLKTHGIPVDVLVFDGLMVRTEYIEGKDLTAILREAEAAITREMDGLTIQLTTKDFDEAIDMTPWRAEMAAAREADQPLTTDDVVAAIAEDIKKGEVSEQTIAKRLSAHVDGRYVWDNNTGILYRWNGHYWCPYNQTDQGTPYYQTLRYELCEVLKKVYQAQAATCTDPKVTRAIDSISRDAFQTAIIRQTRMYLDIRKIRGLTDNEEPWNNMMDVIQFENACYDVNEGWVSPPRPDLYINRSNGVKLTYADYTPEIIAEAAETLKKHTRAMMATDADNHWLWKFIAACARRHNTEELALFWVGRGGNGKGTLADLLRRGFGAEYADLSTAYFTEPMKAGPDANLYDARHARVIMMSETSTGEQFQDGKFKSLTGNDTIRVRTLFQRKEEAFTPGRFILQTNNLPKFVGGVFDAALERRIRIMQFPYQFKSRDQFDENNDSHRLADPAVKEWMKSDMAVLGLWKLIQDYWPIYKAEKLEPTDMMKAATREYMQELDEMGTWLSTTLIADNLEKIPISRLTAEFNEATGNRMSAVIFGKKLKAMDRYKNNIIRSNGTHLKGYKLPRDEDSEEQPSSQ